MLLYSLFLAFTFISREAVSSPFFYLSLGHSTLFCLLTYFQKLILKSILEKSAVKMDWIELALGQTPVADGRL
jgi:hypothetical protein